jgi:molybdate transport system substrate-binding protein
LKNLVLLIAFLLVPAGAISSQYPQVAAASSLQFVLPEIAAAFKRETGHGLRITYGSSGNFRRQITQGAPFDLFLSADESYVRALSEQNLTVDSGRVYALGRVAAIVPKNSSIKLTQDLSGFSSAIAAGQLQHFAIANPDHAPYGKAARETLQAIGLWQTIEPFLVKGENASQAMQFAVSGSSQGGIVAYALALTPNIASVSEVMPIDQSRHQPISQRMVLLKGSGEVARLFYDFIGSPQALRILKAYGFEIPLMREETS